MAVGIKRKLQRVEALIESELSAEYARLSAEAKGMQREGYVGGYLQALRDVNAALQGLPVGENSRYGYVWDMGMPSAFSWETNEN